jgi:hypothetical protein
MEARKVIQIRNSLYINIPTSVVEKLRVKRGEVLWIGYYPGHGAIIAKGRNLGKIAAGVAGTDNIKISADEAFADLKRKVKSLERSAFNNIMVRLMGEGIKRALVDLQEKRVKKVAR